MIDNSVLMNLEDVLDDLENRYYGDLEEDKEAVVAELEPIHRETMDQGLESFREFEEDVIHRFGGAYIPYVFWVELSQFMDHPENRLRLFDILNVFVESDFEENETKKMKGLLITYLAMEKEFEVDKIESLIMHKAHKNVQEYFQKVKTFVEKNKTSVEMYLEKFRMLRHQYPDFELFRMPVIKLKERLAD